MEFFFILPISEFTTENNKPKMVLSNIAEKQTISNYLYENIQQ